MPAFDANPATSGSTAESGREVDVAIIGAGIAGASLGAAIAGHKCAVILEAEDRPGYHATGRSAAIFTESYGNETIRALTAASRKFFENPPAGFSEAPLWSDIELFLIGTEIQKAAIDELYSQVRNHAPGVEIVRGETYEARVPICRPGVVSAAVRDSDAKELDVSAIHQGYLRSFEISGGTIATSAGVTGLRHENGRWSIETGAGSWRAEIVVNAAGAWADRIAELAGVRPVGLTPMRRTVCLVSPPAGAAVRCWPMTVDIDEQFYFKPEGNHILCSPADETPSAPCDAQPEDIDVAIAIDRVQNILDLDVRRVENKWAGLRTFAPDRTPVVGFDPGTPGFFWLAGQGGYGIQTAPAMAELATSLILGRPLPEAIARRGVSAASLALARLAGALEVTG